MTFEDIYKIVKKIFDIFATEKKIAGTIADFEMKA